MPPPISRTRSGPTPQTRVHEAPALSKRKRPEGEPAATDPRQGAASATGALASLPGRGRPPASSGSEKIGRFSVVGRLDSNRLDKLANLSKPSTDKSCAFYDRVEKRMTAPTTVGARDELFDYFARDARAAELNGALRSGDAAQIEQVADDVEAMMPMLTSVPVGMKFNRLLLTEGGWGQRPLDTQAFAEMERRLGAAEPGTVIREEGLMSTAPGDRTHGQWEGQPGIQLRLTAGEKGVRTMGVGADPEMVVDCVFPPGQQLVIVGTERSAVQLRDGRRPDVALHTAEMLTVNAVLLQSAAFGDHVLQAPSDSEPE